MIADVYTNIIIELSKELAEWVSKEMAIISL